MHYLKQDVYTLSAAVTQLTEYYAGVWNSPQRAENGKQYIFGQDEKRKNEKLLNRKMKELTPNKRFLFFKRKNEINFAEFLPALFNSFSRNFLRVDLGREQNFSAESFIDATKKFVRKSRLFDDSLSYEDIYQACRNVWIMNILQLMAGRPVEITPSVFAYSLLYPYCDNFIDSPETPPEEKMKFGKRLKTRLKGEPVSPASPLEEKIFSLIAEIENEHDRSKNPGVYESLLAIHSAQVKSLSLQLSAKGVSFDEMLSIHIEKGGTSVLADGHLLFGNLTGKQRDFIFGLGAFLQFIDDMQDIDEDIATGNLSPLAKETGVNKLDGFAERILNFGAFVLKEDAYFGGKNEPACISVLFSGMVAVASMLTGMLACYYTPAYVKQAEKYSPFRFSYIKRNYEKYSRKGMLLLEKLGE
jgi:hypothetical protein